MVYFLVTACLALGAATVVAERRAKPVLAGVAKVLASLCFVGVALLGGAMETHFGRLILLGLGLSLLGDALLISSRKLLFLGGMAAFGLAHIAYVAGFLRMGAFPPFAWAAGGGLGILFGGGALAWLWPQLDRQWRGPVIAYGIVIIAMLATGLAGVVSGQLALGFGIAALAFAISDISVARDRLTTTDPGSRIWGLPLYFAAQLLFALSI